MNFVDDNNEQNEVNVEDAPLVNAPEAEPEPEAQAEAQNDANASDASTSMFVFTEIAKLIIYISFLFT